MAPEFDELIISKIPGNTTIKVYRALIHINKSIVLNGAICTFQIGKLETFEEIILSGRSRLKNQVF